MDKHFVKPQIRKELPGVPSLSMKDLAESLRIKPSLLMDRLELNSTFFNARKLRLQMVGFYKGHPDYLVFPLETAFFLLSKIDSFTADRYYRFLTRYVTLYLSGSEKSTDNTYATGTN